MPAEAPAGGARFQAGVVVDAHVHTTDYLPAFAASVYRWATRRTVPPPFFLDQLASAGVDAVVANAVGDRAATAWWGGRRGGPSRNSCAGSGCGPSVRTSSWPRLPSRF